MPEPYRLFLDSGAHSLFNLHQKKGGRSTKSHERYAFYRTRAFADYMRKYAAFVKEHQDVIDVYANTDVIGNPEMTYKAQKFLEAQGIHPIPVIHFGTSKKWVERYLSEGYNYIALGGLKGIGREGFVTWADEIWGVICNTPDHMPRAKVHGFAVTSLHVMLRYPWYSVDSTTWCVYARCGVVMVPRYVESTGEFVYDDNILPIVFSNRSPSMNEVGGRHFYTLPEKAQAAALRYVQEQGYAIGSSEWKTVPIDYTLQENEQWGPRADKTETTRTVEVLLERGVSNDYTLRDEINIQYFLNLSKHMPDWPWPFVRRTSKRARPLL